MAACTRDALCSKLYGRLTVRFLLMRARWMLIPCLLWLFTALLSISSSCFQSQPLWCCPHPSFLLESSVDASSSALLPLLHSLVETCLLRHSPHLQSADCHNTICTAGCLSLSQRQHHSSMHSLTAMRSLLRSFSLHMQGAIVVSASFSFAAPQHYKGERSGCHQQRISTAKKHCCCWLTIVSAALISVVL